MHFFGINLIGIKEITRGEIPVANLNILPNPFSKATTITFSTIGNNQTSLLIYDALGRVVKRFNPSTNQACKQISWDGRDDRGYQLPDGVYFVCVKTDAGEQLEKIVLLN
jgi:flagellar hook assembly protein FlgD